MIAVEDKIVWCACRIAPDTPENVCAYTLAPNSDCEHCHGTGSRIRRTTYDRKPEIFAKILHEEWL